MRRYIRDCPFILSIPPMMGGGRESQAQGGGPVMGGMGCHNHKIGGTRQVHPHFDCFIIEVHSSSNISPLLSNSEDEVQLQNQLINPVIQLHACACMHVCMYATMSINAVTVPIV